MRFARPLPLALTGLVLFGWLALWVWGASPYARYLGHDTQPDSAAATAATLTIFLFGWALMITAMMLPTASGLLRAFEQVVGERPDRGRLQALVIAGFLGTWVVVGYVFQAVDLGVHSAVAAIAWLDARPQLIGAGALALAGAFQFTPLKHRCLTACRTPRSFIYRHWRGGRSEGDAARIGVAYGTSCVGCCWALMLLLFALGTASLVWMFVVALLMAVEKSTTWGAKLSRPLGVGLIAAAGVVVVVG